jgi:hypothetical protein
MTMIRLHSTAIALTVASALVAVGCGEPTAQVLDVPDSPFRYELPTEFDDIGVEVGNEAGRVFGLPGTDLAGLASDPVFLLTTMPSGETASFKSLRLLATGGELDPLDESVPLPSDIQLLDYVEYGGPDVWGVRLRLIIGRGAADFQALVDRQSDQVAITELFCTQACFVDNVELIDQIQASWSLEP